MLWQPHRCMFATRSDRRGQAHRKADGPMPSASTPLPVLHEMRVVDTCVAVQIRLDYVLTLEKHHANCIFGILRPLRGQESNSNHCCSET